VSSQPAESGTPPASRVSDEGFTLSADVDTTTDVLFDGRRIWSVAPLEFRLDKAGERWVPWPRLLLPSLDGVTTVTVMEHSNEGVIFEEEHAFGTSTERLRFEGPGGALRVIDKWGFIQRPFAHQSQEIRDDLLDGAELILTILREDCDLPAWIAFGSLLGAVREGKMIGHDSDVDLAYLSKHEHPADVAREMFRVSRALQAHGLKVSTRTGSFCAVTVQSKHGRATPIDVYACFYVGDKLYETASVGAPIPREAVLPLGTVEFEGRTMPAPADTEAMLEASYGPSWRVPDPAFAYHTPRAVKRRFNAWFSSSMKRRRYWDRVYGGVFGIDLPTEPSSFAEWVLPQLDDGAPVIDLGCGNGRDSLFFAKHGHPTTGLDFSPAALGRVAKEATAADLPTTFDYLNLYDYRSTVTRAALVTRDVPAPRTVYARFLLHQLEPDGLATTWSFLDMALRRGGRAFLEFRTHRDERLPHTIDGYRRFLDPDKLCREIETAGGQVVDRSEGTGLAVYKNEDPDICRLTVVWQR